MSDWRNAARCRNEDPELFFPIGETGHAAIQAEEAKAICRTCPVIEQCLQFALDEGIDEGVFGGLTGTERASLRRSVRRGNTAPEDIHAKAAIASKPKPRTLKEMFQANTTRLYGGHLAWIGPPKPHFQGRPLNPKKVAFLVDRGREPEGRVLSDCGNSECVLPAHVADDAERMQCGARAGYQRHLRDGSKICEPCRQANTDANNRLLRTGSTKKKAAA